MATRHQASTRHQAAAIGQSVGQAAAQTREAIGEAVERGTERAGEVYEKAKGRAGEMYERASERLGEWKDEGVHQIRVVRGVVRRNTLTSMLIAFGVGFILARLVFRRT